MPNGTDVTVSYCKINTHNEFYETAQIYESIINHPNELYLALMNVTFAAVGSTTNLAILIFLLNNKSIKDVPTLLFVVLCCTDMVTSVVLGSFQTLVSFRIIRLTEFVMQSFFSFKLISMLYNIVTRFSLFQFTLMSVSRCLLVRSPFRQLNRHAVSGSLIGYLLLLLVMFLLPFWLCSDPHMAYKPTLIFRIGSVHVEDVVLFQSGTVDLKSGLLVLLYELLTTCLPLVPTVTSCVFTGVELLRRRGSDGSPYFQEKRRSAVTVVLLTSSTVLCFLPRTAFVLSFLFQDWTLADLLLTRHEEEGWRLMYLLTTGLAIANSSINPLIFIVRSKNIKWYWGRVIGVTKENCERPLSNKRTLQPSTTVLTNINNVAKKSRNKWSSTSNSGNTLC